MPFLLCTYFVAIFETNREAWPLRTGFGIAPVNKLVSLTWLLWALRSFRSFTLHYITLHKRKRVLQMRKGCESYTKDNITKNDNLNMAMSIVIVMYELL